MSDVVVIGAGIAGLVASLRLRDAGRSVTLLTKGIGGLQLSQGTIDVLGDAPERTARPLDAVDALAGRRPGHPYARLGRDGVRAGVEYLQQIVGPDVLVGDPERNVFIPTAVGAVRPTCLVPPSMAAGECVDGARFVIVGLRRMKDFAPELIAGNLSRTRLADGGRVQARAARIDVAARENEVDSSGLVYARALDDPAFRRRFAEAVRRVVEPGESVGLPAVLGLNDPAVWRDVQEIVGAPVFEIPVPPPSVPGMRLNQLLTQKCKDARVRFVLGSKVIGMKTEDGRATAVTLDTAGAPRDFRADHVIHAAGGFESGAITMDSHGGLAETILGLPLHGAEEPDLVTGEYWRTQKLFEVGLAVDDRMRVLGPDGDVVHPNLYAAGGVIAGATRWDEKSGEGIALASAVRAADSIIEEYR